MNALCEVLASLSRAFITGLLSREMGLFNLSLSRFLFLSALKIYEVYRRIEQASYLPAPSENVFMHISQMHTCKSFFSSS